MAQELKRGDHVEWNFRGHTVRGRIRRRITKRMEVAGQIAAGTPDDPRYLVRSEKSGAETIRRGTALRRVRE
jgi:hypothetical protein